MSYPPPPPGFPPTGPPGYGGFGAPVPPQRAPGMAVASLVLGILGVTIGLCLWFLPVMQVLAVIFGHVSLSRINAGGLPGRGLAITGIVTGYVGLAIAAIVLIVTLIGVFTPSGPTL
jgi:hypothetical protein